MQTRCNVMLVVMAVFAAAALLFLANTLYFSKKDGERLMALYGVDPKSTRLGPNFLVDYYREHIQPATPMAQVHTLIRGYDAMTTEKRASLTLEHYTFRLGLIDSLGITVAYDDRGRYLNVDETDRL